MGQVKKAATVRKMTFSGDLTLLRAAELRDSLLQELSAGTVVELDFKEVTSVDLSLLQILCAGHLSARQQDKILRLGTALPEALLRLTDDGGFSGHIGCAIDGRAGCLLEQK